MADDLRAQLMAQQSLINSAQAGGKGAPILMGLADVNISNLSIKGRGFNADKTAATVNFGKQGKFADKLLAGMQSVVDDLKKINQNGGVMYAGNVTNGAPVSSNLPPMSGDGPMLG